MQFPHLVFHAPNECCAHVHVTAEHHDTIQPLGESGPIREHQIRRWRHPIEHLRPCVLAGKGLHLMHLKREPQPFRDQGDQVDIEAAPAIYRALVLECKGRPDCITHVEVAATQHLAGDRTVHVDPIADCARYETLIATLRGGYAYYRGKGKERGPTP